MEQLTSRLLTYTNGAFWELAQVRYRQYLSD